MNFDVNNLRIASPCPKSWNEMTGDDRTRHCDLCELSVHNVEGMTRDEVARLVNKGGGRLCMRLVRRADGTVMTKDCPVGLRAYRKRVAGFATAAFAAVLGLLTTSYAQDKDTTTVNPSPTQVTQPADTVGRVSISGVVTDPNGAVIPDLRIMLLQNETKLIAETQSDKNGEYSFKGIAPGAYRIHVHATKKSGFLEYIQDNVKASGDRDTVANIVLAVRGKETVLIGVVGGMEMIDMTSNERKTVFTREMLDRMPGGRPF